ncbi:aldo/keto reductase [Rhizobium sp. BR 315]|uniref:aldo/keto reductase n=1 Tax=Rhizobium sp. BR 315 TaxID=3040014 RepID=UPI003D329775
MQYVIANEAKIPALGFGTYGMRGTALVQLISEALRAGFRHVDTAQIYGNETEVGEGILRSGLRRADVFVTTKVWVANYSNDNFAQSVDESLKKLNTDYVDLLLLHWPNAATPLADQIGLLNETVKQGKARHIGVSNFNRSLIAQAVTLSDRPLVANQFEFHPFLDQDLMMTATRGVGMTIIAYCAMAVGRVFHDPTLMRIAESHGRSISQIVLRWLVQQGVVALSRSSRADRIRDNVEVFDFELTSAEMSEIAKLATPGSRIVNPPGLAPAWD